MTDPRAHEHNEDLGAAPKPDAPALTPAEEPTVVDNQPTPPHAYPTDANPTDANPTDANPTDADPTESTHSPWAQPPGVQAGSNEPTELVPAGKPTAPPPGAPPEPAQAAGVAAFGDRAFGETAFGQEPITPPASATAATAGGWSGATVSPGQPPQPGGGQPAGMPPGSSPYSAHPPEGQPGTVPPTAPPGALPPGQMPPGAAYQPAPPKPYSPVPWIILAVVLALGLLGISIVGWLTIGAVETLQETTIDFDEDTVSEYLEYDPSAAPTDGLFDDASDTPSAPSGSPLPGIPPAPNTNRQAPFTVPDPAQVQGDPYDPVLDAPEGAAMTSPVEMAVGETKEAKVGPRQLTPIKVNLKAGQKVTIAVKGEALADYRMWITNPSNELAGFGDDSTDTEPNGISLDPRIEFEAKTDGVHTVLVNNAFSINESVFTISVNE